MRGHHASQIIGTKHGGYDIVYREVDDKWECYDLNLTSTSLSVMRTKINHHSASARRVGSFKAFEIREYSNNIRPLVVTLIIDEKECWVVTHNKRREKLKYEDLIADTPENRKAIKAWQNANDAVSAAEKTAEKALNAIPRLSRRLLLEAKVEKAEEET